MVSGRSADDISPPQRSKKFKWVSGRAHPRSKATESLQKKPVNSAKPESLPAVSGLQTDRDSRLTHDLFRFSNRELQSLIGGCRNTKVKSKNIHALSKILVNEYNSRIPKTIEELVKLPGVGRKTASVFLAETFDHPTIAVDTHVLRVSHRLGLSTKRHDPIQTEKELKLLFPKDFWRYLSMSFVQFGRDICDAKKPLCEVCDFNNSCKYYLSLNT